MKFFKYLFSGSFMGILLLVFAVAIGYATFVENDYDAITAKAHVYNTRWFELILFLMVVNFSGMIFTRKLYTKSQLNVLVIHLALIIIIIGAGVTRYIGYEGQMHIREGQISNRFLTSETFFDIKLTNGNDTASYISEVMLSLKKRNLLRKNLEVGNSQVEVILEEYFPNASEVVVRSETGSPYINVIVGGSDGRHDLYIKEGESSLVHGLGITFGDTTKTNYIQIVEDSAKLFMRLPQSATKANAFRESQLPTGFFPIEKMSVHTIFNTSFVVKDYFEKATKRYVRGESNNSEGSRVAKLNINGETLYALLGREQSIKVGEMNGLVYLGNKYKELPFSLKLNKFILERYPGSNSPSSYASDVQVINEAAGDNFQYDIYMNNILNYGGFRFFQTSYDPDEKGTYLTVNHDYMGTWITYFGYFLLFLTLIISFFTSKTRFQKLLHKIKETHSLRKGASASIILLMCLAMPAKSQDNPNNVVVSQQQAVQFGELLIQNREGRILPINTMSNQFLVKIHKKDSYQEYSADQIFLDLIINADKWQKEPLVKVNDPSIQSILGISNDFASFSDFLDEQNLYKLKQQVEQAYAKQPSARNTFDKEIMNVDERANILYQLLNGAYLNIFPLPDDPNNKWATPADYHGTVGHDNTESQLFNDYLQRVIEAKTTGDYSRATALLDEFKSFQRKAGAEVVPSVNRVNKEISYNKLNIFKKLFPFYFILGMVMIGIFMLQIFKPKMEFAVLRKILTLLLLIAFIFQTYGLGLRWYISGHEPWSNGYESMIYIAWAIILAGFIFMKVSYATLGVTSLLAGITLLTAHMSWMNPEITNLVPVLKSYWLTIHVATITASYGFLALACMMGFLNLCIMIFRNEENRNRVNLVLKELTLIVELSLVVGLVLLIIGNFLGAIWANESWGRYWGWDPKESWTLVSVIIYSLILHLRIIPAVRNAFTFNLFAILGFATILMTYFGVNFYLSGLHSYADGDAVPIPAFVYYTLLVIAVVSIIAGRNHYKMKEHAKVLADT